MGAIFFILYFVGTFLVTAGAASLAAFVSRKYATRMLLLSGFNIAFQILFATLFQFVLSYWNLESGSESFWTRYMRSVLSQWWEFSLPFGMLFGVVGFIWCAKQLPLSE